MDPGGAGMDAGELRATRRRAAAAVGDRGTLGSLSFRSARELARGERERGEISDFGYPVAVWCNFLVKQG